MDAFEPTGGAPVDTSVGAGDMRDAARTATAAGAAIGAVFVVSGLAVLLERDASRRFAIGIAVLLCVPMFQLWLAQRRLLRAVERCARLHGTAPTAPEPSAPRA